MRSVFLVMTMRVLVFLLPRRIEETGDVEA
jgi:hypothetical protein